MRLCVYTRIGRDVIHSCQEIVAVLSVNLVILLRNAKQKQLGILLLSKLLYSLWVLVCLYSESKT